MAQKRKKSDKRPPYKRSKQRERILALLRSTDTHPTANWLFGKLKKEFPNLSLGTIYRNIGILVHQGLIGRIAFGSTFDRLDANVTEHYHFICERCDAVIDLKLPVRRSLDKQVPASEGFRVHRHAVEFYGLCPKCAKKA
ncbi:MAG TPA: transcriptional repressor [Spirochaetia bacterium]|nr:transcriptional repressor [Spirochaetia bacterium]